MCDYIRNGGDRARFLARFASAASAGFDPERDLRAHRPGQPDDDADVRVARDRRDAQGRDDRPLGQRGNSAAHYQAFDTICSATQDRQDAVVALLRDRPVDLMIVIGGYNSSNTANLARICAASRPTFHIADPDCLLSRDEIRHRPVGAKAEVIGHGLAAADRSGHDRPDVRRLDA